MGTTLDVTGLKEAERALHISESRFRQIVETAQEGIWVLDSAGRTTFANARMAEMLRCTIPDLNTRTFFDFADDAELERHGQARSDISHQCDFHFRRQDGSDLWTLISASPIRDESGLIVGSINMVADITERKLVEDHRLRLATMVESSRDPIIGTTPDGIVISWNRGAERLFGYRAHEVVGESISVIHPPGQSDELAHIAGRLRRGETIDQYEAVRVRKDGQLVDVSLTISPIQDSLGNVVGNATVVRDITEARRSEAALRASEERLRTVLANAPLILFAFDRDGRYTVRTGRALAGLATDQGISAIEPSKRSTDELYEDHPQVQVNIRRVLAGESFSSLVEVDGRVFDCAYSPIWGADGLIDGAVGVATDVTERHQAQRDLERLQHAHELILQSAGEGIYGQDRQGLTTFVNPAAARMLGWAVEELIGCDMHAVLHGRRADGSAYPREECPIHTAIADGNVHHATGELFWRKDGASFPVEYICTPMRDESRIIGAVVTFRDISQRRAAEEELAALYEKLLARDRTREDCQRGSVVVRHRRVPFGVHDEQLDCLTRRERDVLQKPAGGHTNAEIASALGLGTGTVKSHVEHILKKLGLASRTQAALWADRRGPEAFSTTRSSLAG